MDPPEKKKLPDAHHIWCNFFTRPVDGCPMCKGLWDVYPYTSLEEEKQLMEKHFQDNVSR